MTNFIRENIPFIIVTGQILVLGLLIIYLFKNKFPKATTLIEKYALLLGFLFSSFALCGSLFYSDVLGYEPCKFCWWQRIFMYPLVAIFLIAMWRKDVSIHKYTLPISAIGSLLALNHYILQLTGTSIFPCSAVGYSASCSKVFVLSFGYITIPLMAFTAFLGVIVPMLFLRRQTKKDAVSI
jgi:disulfide bond formation protein DsbB